MFAGQHELAEHRHVEGFQSLIEALGLVLRALTNQNYLAAPILYDNHLVEWQ